MRLVVDASVAVKWLVEEDYSEAADNMLDGRHELHAPRLMASEVGNALWQKVRRGEIERGLAGVLISAVSDMGVRWADDETICADATRLAVALDRPVYDCVYLALANRIGAILVTTDERFANALAGTEHGGAVVTLSQMVLE